MRSASGMAGFCRARPSGSTQRQAGASSAQYPWGTTDPGTDNQYAIYGCDYPSGLGVGHLPSVANIAPVGTATLGAGLWGQLDLAGEVCEWNLDWLALSGNYADPCTDCAYLPVAYTPADDSRVMRGGYFSNYAGGPTSDLLPPNRASRAPASGFDALGFRCARTP